LKQTFYYNFLCPNFIFEILPSFETHQENRKQVPYLGDNTLMLRNFMKMYWIWKFLWPRA